MLTEESLKQVYEKVKPKPERYHFICYAGSPVKSIDIWKNENIYECPKKGEENWLNSSCKECDGLLEGIFELSEYQEWEDFGMQKLLKAIIKKLNDSNKCTCWKCQGFEKDPYGEDN